MQPQCFGFCSDTNLVSDTNLGRRRDWDFVLVGQIAGATLSDFAKTVVGTYLVSKGATFTSGKGIRSCFCCWLLLSWGNVGWPWRWCLGILILPYSRASGGPYPSHQNPLILSPLHMHPTEDRSVDQQTSNQAEAIEHLCLEWEKRGIPTQPPFINQRSECPFFMLLLMEMNRSIACWEARAAPVHFKEKQNGEERVSRMGWGWGWIRPRREGIGGTGGACWIYIPFPGLIHFVEQCRLALAIELAWSDLPHGGFWGLQVSHYWKKTSRSWKSHAGWSGSCTSTIASLQRDLGLGYISTHFQNAFQSSPLPHLPDNTLTVAQMFKPFPSRNSGKGSVQMFCQTHEADGISAQHWCYREVPKQ